MVRKNTWSTDGRTGGHQAANVFKWHTIFQKVLYNIPDIDRTAKKCVTCVSLLWKSTCFNYNFILYQKLVSITFVKNIFHLCLTPVTSVITHVTMMDLDARKMSSVFVSNKGADQPARKTSLRLRAGWSAHLLFAYLKVSLLLAKFQFSS